MGTKSERYEAIGAFFGAKWHLYQKAIRKNVLCHDDMFAALDRFLIKHFDLRSINFVDFGCGDASAILHTLTSRNVARYTGVDASSELLVSAGKTLAALKCPKELICQDMGIAVKDLSSPVDVMFCSYSLHHLLTDQKAQFVRDCYDKLSASGCLIVIDGVAEEGETRDHWLHRLEKRFVDNVPDFTAEDLAQIMKHPRESDHPETIGTFRDMAARSPWRSFDVLLERDNFLAFMAFMK